MSDILQDLKVLNKPMSDILLIVNIFSDIGVLFRFEMADYLPQMCFSCQKLQIIRHRCGAKFVKGHMSEEIPYFTSCFVIFP